MTRPRPQWTEPAALFLLGAGTLTLLSLNLFPEKPNAKPAAVEPPLTATATFPAPLPEGVVVEGVERTEVQLPHQGKEVQAGSRTQLHLIAFSTMAEATSTDVTAYTRWSIPKETPPRATVDEHGLLTVDLKAAGSIDVTARWKNGDTTTSTTLSLTITPRP